MDDSASIKVIALSSKMTSGRALSSDSMLPTRYSGLLSLRAGIGIAASAHFRIFYTPGYFEILSKAAAGAVVFAKNSSLILGQNRVSWIAGRQKRHQLH